MALRAVFKEGTGFLSVHRQARSCPDRGSLSRKCRPWEELSSLAHGQASACPLSCRSPWPSPEGRGSWAKGHTTSVPPEDVAGCQRAHAGRPRGGGTCVPVETQQGLLALKSPPRHPGEKREASMEVQTRCGHLHLAQNSDLSPVLSGPRTPCFCYGSPRSPGPSGPPGVPELLLGSSCQIPLPAPRPPEALAWPCVGGQGKATTPGCGEDTVLGGDLPCVDLRQHGAQCGAAAPEPTGKTLALPFALLLDAQKAPSF